jgi:hypothetical protein
MYIYKQSCNLPASGLTVAVPLQKVHFKLYHMF